MKNRQINACLCFIDMLAYFYAIFNKVDPISEKLYMHLSVSFTNLT